MRYIKITPNKFKGVLFYPAMALDLLLISISATTLLIATYTDLKTREVPDWLNYGLLIAVFGVRAIYSIEGEWHILLSGVLGFLVSFGLASLFYYTHQWGGGDSKLLMGLGAAIGVSYPFTGLSLNLFFFLFGLLILGAFYGLCWMGYAAYLNKTNFLPLWKESLHLKRHLHLTTGLTSLLLLGLTPIQPLLLILALIPFLLFHSFIFIKSVEKTCFIKHIPLHKATEGDWMVEDVKVGRKILVSSKTLEKEDLAILRAANIPSIVIKEGVPFVPSFLLSYVLLLFGKELWAWGLRLVFG
ncbi:prepilin peptidase [Candidatus Woesearchaeota archaeon]|nr:prepilin peptidase [Candidatus Woesearchaeota archaeon]